MRRILIVRMSALGDIVHALPVLAALREAHPAAEIDWLVDRPYAGVLDLVNGLDRRVIGRPGLLGALGKLRHRSYDVAFDLQGLLKSSAMARFSGAARVIGFETPALRERMAAWFHTESVAIPPRAHVIQKNLALLSAVGIDAPAVRFPFVVPDSPVADRVAHDIAAEGGERFVLFNPGAAWPNKRWPVDRFGALARRVRDQHSLPGVVLWGRREAALADAVVAASGGAAIRAPETSLGDLLVLSARAALMISGDTGPLHLAGAMGTPLVGLYGPTWPERNGPWHPDDEVVSRAAQCACHHKRQCQRDGRAGDVESRMCISDISVDEVARAVERRLARAGRR